MFDKKVLLENMMGPNCIKLCDELTQKILLRPGMRVLDLGCGKGLTSVFLAKKFGVSVFAADLWIEPTENYERFKSFAVDDRVFPIYAEAHALPFARGFFDAVVSIDSFHYYGAGEDYLDSHLAPLIKKGGTIAVTLPGLQKDFFDDVPEELKPFWLEEDMNFYSADWWEKLWRKSSKTVFRQAFSHSCHAEAWADWLECDNPYAKRDIDMMKAEGGKYFDSIGLIAQVI